MPPSDFFFSKKWRAIVKRESHQKDGVITKRQRMLYDGNDRDDSEFAKEVAGSLGAFATANQWSVENLAEQLRHKILLVGQLQDQILTMEQTVRNKMSQDFEQIRAHDRHQIQQLQANLEELHRNSQANKGLVTQRDELIGNCKPD
jgi:DNA anti-recombination protein RmuC